jgi:hypothetical protein
MRKMKKTSLILSSIFLLSWAAQAQTPKTHYDPGNIIGAGECGRCHTIEHLGWNKSQHYKTFKDLPSSPNAEEIADKLDIFDITEEAACLQCHFTLKQEGSNPKAISGISCELCHGAGKEWVNIHNDLGEYKDNKEAEPPEHKLARLEKSYAAGMQPLTGFYDFVSSCFKCHTVPNEELVNKGGHKAGSEFEFIAWSQGEVRHNFLKSEVENAVRPREHLQLMYVVGRALDLEYGLRGLANATSDGVYAKAMVARVQNARNHLVDIIVADPSIDKARVDIPELKALVDVVPTEFMFNNKEEYTKLADHVQMTSKTLIEKLQDIKGELVKLDRLIPLSNKWKGESFRD